MIVKELSSFPSQLCLVLALSPGRWQDSYSAFWCPNQITAVSRRTASFEGFLLEVRKFLPEVLPLIPSWLSLIIGQNWAHAHFGHWQDQWGGISIPLSHIEEQQTAAHLDNHSVPYSQSRVCVYVCVFTPLPGILNSVSLCLLLLHLFNILG